VSGDPRTLVDSCGPELDADGHQRTPAVREKNRPDKHSNPLIIDSVDDKELKRLRRRLGKTQRELARDLGVHTVTLARWEGGVHKVPQATARLLRLLAARKGK
jgi:DNA-binding transcriptional regulator YiaG